MRPTTLSACSGRCCGKEPWAYRVWSRSQAQEALNQRLREEYCIVGVSQTVAEPTSSDHGSQATANEFDGVERREQSVGGNEEVKIGGESTMLRFSGKERESHCLEWRKREREEERVGKESG